MLIITACLVAVAGCGGQSRSSFVSKANHECVKAEHQLDAKRLPRTTADGIDYALNYYTGLDLAVSTLREMSLPHRDAATLRRRWLDPAQHALTRFLSVDMPRIRAASRSGDSATVNNELRRLERAGSDGVDAGYLKDLGVSSCLPLFGTA